MVAPSWMCAFFTSEADRRKAAFASLNRNDAIAYVSANLDRIRNVALHVKREVEAGYDVAVVVSAMSGKTNELVAWCKDASALYDMSEYDAVVASGEQVTSGLLAIALQNIGIKARSWQGWQIPIQTDDAHGSARILGIDGSRLKDSFTNQGDRPFNNLGTWRFGYQRGGNSGRNRR